MNFLPWLSSMAMLINLHVYLCVNFMITVNACAFLIGTCLCYFRWRLLHNLQKGRRGVWTSILKRVNLHNSSKSRISIAPGLELKTGCSQSLSFWAWYSGCQLGMKNIGKESNLHPHINMELICTSLWVDFLSYCLNLCIFCKVLWPTCHSLSLWKS